MTLASAATTTFTLTPVRLEWAFVALMTKNGLSLPILRKRGGTECSRITSK
jgi:hypothetical protein